MSDDDFFGIDDTFELSAPPPTLSRLRDQTSQILLPRALFENTVGIDGINEISSAKSLCLIVEAPSAAWVDPISTMLRYMSTWDYRLALASTPKSSKIDASQIEAAISSLSSGGRVFAVSQNPDQFIPETLLACADHTVRLPVPDVRTIGAVIRALTGKLPKSLRKEDFAGLDFPDLAVSLRKGATPKQCVDRLKACVAKRSPRSEFNNVPHLSDLHGYGSARQWGLDLIQDLESWRRGEIAFDDIDKNVVLSSAPGLGKTSFVASLAKSANLPLIATSVSDWFANSPGYLDSVIKSIDQTFAAAKAAAPAIVFLDEIDAVPNRATISQRGADWWLPVITHLLLVLDSAVSSTTQNLIVIGATNHSEKLDKALVRPGRLSKIIEIEPPDAEALEGIFRQHLGPDLPKADLTSVAHLAAGASGAQVVAWVRAARRQARQNRRAIELQDLISAVMPPETREPELVHRIAVHEAGHAVASHALVFGEVKSISLRRDGGRGGGTWTQPFRHAVCREAIENTVVQALAGRAAEEVVLGQPGSGSGGSASSDLGSSTLTLGMLHLSAGLGDDLIYRADREDIPKVLALNQDLSFRIDEHLKLLYQKALRLAEDHKSQILAVAEALVERRFLSSADFSAIIERSNCTEQTEAQPPSGNTPRPRSRKAPKND